MDFSNNLLVAQQEAMKISDQVLNDPIKRKEFEKTLIDRHTITAPYFNEDEWNVTFGSINMTMNNAPTGFSYVSGNLYHTAEFKIPIEGEISIFNTYVALRLKANKSWIKGKDFFYRFYSNKPIIEDENKHIEAQNEIKAEIQSIRNVLIGADEKVTSYNEDLRNLVSKTISEEELKRSQLKKAIKNVNPFE